MANPNYATVDVPGVTTTIYLSVDFFIKAVDWERAAEASGSINGRSTIMAIGRNGDWTSTYQALGFNAVSDDHLVWSDWWNTYGTVVYDQWTQLEIAIRPAGGDFEVSVKFDGGAEEAWTGAAVGDNTSTWESIAVGALYDFNEDGGDHFYLKNVQVAIDDWVSEGGTVIWDDSFSGGFAAWDGSSLDSSNSPYTSGNVTPPSEPGVGTAYYLAGGFEEWKRKNLGGTHTDVYSSIELMIPQEYYDNIIWSATVGGGAETHRSKFLQHATFALEFFLSIQASDINIAFNGPDGEAGAIMDLVPDTWYQFEIGQFATEPGINTQWAYAIDGSPISFATTGYISNVSFVRFGAWDAGFSDLNQADFWDNYFLRNFSYAFDTWISDGGTPQFTDALDGTFQTYDTSFGDNFFFQIP